MQGRKVLSISKTDFLLLRNVSGQTKPASAETSFRRPGGKPDFRVESPGVKAASVALEGRVLGREERKEKGLQQRLG